MPDSLKPTLKDRYLAAIAALKARANRQWQRERAEAWTHAIPEPKDEPAWMIGWRRETKAQPAGEAPDAPPEWSLSQRPTITQARATIENAILDYLLDPAPDHILLIRAAPGLGKTTAAVLAAETASTDHRVLYAGPRHDFFTDVLGIAQEPDSWYEWLPRQEGDENHCETCPHAATIGAWMRRGYKAIDYCSQICGWPYVSNQCVYHEQKQRTEPIIFGMHEHVVLGHPLEFSLLVGDEDPTSKFCNLWRIPSRWIMPRDMDATHPFMHIVYALFGIAEEGQAIWGPQLIDALGGAERVRDAAADYVEFWQPTPHLDGPEDVEKKDYRHVPDLANLLHREATLMAQGSKPIWRVGVWGKGLNLFLRNSADERMPGHVIWLDATANRTLYQQCFQRNIKIVDPEPRSVGHIYQVYGRQYGKTSLFNVKQTEEEGRVVSGTRYTGQVEKTIQRIVQDHNYKAPALITFKDMPQVSSMFRDMAHGHFYAARGTNQFEGCDSLFVVGTPQPSTRDVQNIARMLYFERDRAFADVWTTSERRYRYDDGSDKVWTGPASGFWADDDLQSVLASVREAELEQAAHRARPLHRNVDVWLITNLPTNLPLDGLYSLSEIFGTPLGTSVWEWDRFLEHALAEGRVEATPAAEALRMHRGTILRYMKVLEDKHGWVRDTVVRAPGQRGQPPKALKPPD